MKNQLQECYTPSTNRTAYKNDWQKEHTDRISLTVPKGRKEELQEHAQQHGESLNAFINRAISKTLEQDETTDLIEKCAKEENMPVEKAKKNSRPWNGCKTYRL